MTKLLKVTSEVRLTPVVSDENTCPLLGMYSDGKLSVDGFLELKREDAKQEV